MRRLCSVLFLVTCCSYSNAQISGTGDIINNAASAWQGCFTTASGAFWGGYSGGPCPAMDPSTGHIIFSYGKYTLSQTIDLPTVLPNSGTGLQVNGYYWGWSLINDTAPTAHIDVTLYNKDGSIAETDRYNYGGFESYGWYSTSGTRTYATPHPLTEVDKIQLSITSEDRFNWAGYYGPNFANLTLSVNYSVDPCYDNPFWSTTCSGYWEAFQQLMANAIPADDSTTDTTNDYSITGEISPSLSAMPLETTTGEIVVDVGGVELSTTGEMSVPDGIPQEVKEKKIVDTNLISKIVKEATDDSKALAIVNQSIEQSMAEDANPNFSMENETLTAISQQRENSIQQSILENQQVSENSINFLTDNSFIESTNSIQSFGDISSTGIIEDQSTSMSTSMQIQLNNSSKDRIIIEKGNAKENTQTVNKNSKNNDAAGDVSIESIATEPMDFNQYLDKQLVDAQFYASKDIYRRQQNVDNARALRGLGTDLLHQQMVEEQYKGR